MRYYLTALAGLGLASAAIPASAMIVIFDSPGAVQPDENVLFKGAPPSGNKAFGVTNKSNTGVTFTGNEALVTPSKGQARVAAADGGLSQLAFMLTNPTLGFKEVEFNIFGTKATATSVTLNFLDQFGTTFGDTFTINNGQNFFRHGRWMTSSSPTSAFCSMAMWPMSASSASAVSANSAVTVQARSCRNPKAG